MSSTTDFIKKLEQHESGSSTLEGAEALWYHEFVHGVVAKGELNLKNELEGYYQEHTEKKNGRVIQIWYALPFFFSVCS